VRRFSFCRKRIMEVLRPSTLLAPAHRLGPEDGTNYRGEALVSLDAIL
jgi:hypothetical protein